MRPIDLEEQKQIQLNILIKIGLFEETIPIEFEKQIFNVPKMGWISIKSIWRLYGTPPY